MRPNVRKQPSASDDKNLKKGNNSSSAAFVSPTKSKATRKERPSTPSKSPNVSESGSEASNDHRKRLSSDDERQDTSPPHKRTKRERSNSPKKKDSAKRASSEVSRSRKPPYKSDEENSFRNKRLASKVESDRRPKKAPPLPPPHHDYDPYPPPHLPPRHDYPPHHHMYPDDRYKEYSPPLDYDRYGRRDPRMMPPEREPPPSPPPSWRYRDVDPYDRYRDPRMPPPPPPMYMPDDRRDPWERHRRGDTPPPLPPPKDYYGRREGRLDPKDPLYYHEMDYPAPRGDMMMRRDPRYGAYRPPPYDVEPQWDDYPVREPRVADHPADERRPRFQNRNRDDPRRAPPNRRENQRDGPRNAPRENQREGQRDRDRGTSQPSPMKGPRDRARSKEREDDKDRDKDKRKESRFRRDQKLKEIEEKRENERQKTKGSRQAKGSDNNANDEQNNSSVSETPPKGVKEEIGEINSSSTATEKNRSKRVKRSESPSCNRSDVESGEGNRKSRVKSEVKDELNDSSSDLSLPEITLGDIEEARDKDDLDEQSDLENVNGSHDSGSLHYDPISDEEIDNIIGQHAGIAEENEPPIVDPLDIDWSLLMENSKKNAKENENGVGSMDERYKAHRIFEKIGLSKKLAGEELWKEVEKVCKAERAEAIENRVDSTPFSFLSSIPVFHMAALQEKKSRSRLLDLGPYRRALSARKDLEIRRNLLKLKCEKKTTACESVPTLTVEDSCMSLE